MKITLKTVAESQLPLLLLVQTAEKLPAKTAWWVARFQKKVEKEFLAFNEIRNAKIREFCQPRYLKDDKGEFVIGPDGNKVHVKDHKGGEMYEDDESATAAIKELESQEIEIPFDKLALSAFEGASVSPASFSGLDWMIDETK